MIHGKRALIEGTYWARDKLIAGAYPRARNVFRLRPRLREFLQAGVTFFLDLTEEREKRLWPYATPLRKEAAAMGRAVEYRRMPIPDFDTPMVEQMKRILNVLDEHLENGNIVYMHCYAGLGRTGTVVGCYLVRHGMSGQEALEELVHLRRGTDLDGYASPVTDEQRQMVLDWAALDVP